MQRRANEVATMQGSHDHDDCNEFRLLRYGCGAVARWSTVEVQPAQRYNSPGLHCEGSDVIVVISGPCKTTDLLQSSTLEEITTMQ